ncbi:methyltransferase domain-containing protein [bacterium]|nr:methyltransferase domain-containing protein [bacterium]
MAEIRLNKKILALHFSQNAARYHREARLQREIAFQLAELAFPEDGGAPTRDRLVSVLELGCGTGFLTGHILHRLAPERLVAVDLALGMLGQARRTLNGAPGAAAVRYLCADCEKLPLAGRSFDLVASSTTLQWVESLEGALAGIHSLLRPGGRLVAATLGRGTFRELRQAYRVSSGRLGIRLAASRYGPVLPGAEELRQMLSEAGFSGVTVESRPKLEFFPGCREFMLSIKALGASNPNFRPMSLDTERRLLQGVIDYYNRSYRVDGQVFAGYEVLFLTAVKPGGD